MRLFFLLKEPVEKRNSARSLRSRRLLSELLSANSPQSSRERAEITQRKARSTGAKAALFPFEKEATGGAA